MGTVNLKRVKERKRPSLQGTGVRVKTVYTVLVDTGMTVHRPNSTATLRDSSTRSPDRACKKQRVQLHINDC